MTLEFKEATTEDELRKIESIAFNIWNEHYVPIIGQAQVDYMLEKYQSYAAMKQQIESESYEYFSINYDNLLIGYFAVQPQNNMLFLSKLYLTNQNRGKGFAKITQTHIDQLAREKKLDHIKLTVNKYNSGSIAAYQALGFEIVEEAVFDIGSGYVMDDYVMIKRL
ncbi:GNAT family N-acetyltransferase [Pleionea sediminis]|uniref:GNAT family N-acetyltransferase n=1 Tax=Pleionea sediminis TaxID=2569479 RepID=UPI001186423E|nr:GNAT family N-acetyltransferase [Pleionea sediminis]